MALKYNISQYTGVQTPNVLIQTSNVPVDNRAIVDSEDDLFNAFSTFLIGNTGNVRQVYDIYYQDTYTDVTMPLYTGMTVVTEDTGVLYVLRSFGLYYLVTAQNTEDPDDTLKLFFEDDTSDTAIFQKLKTPTSVVTSMPISDGMTEEFYTDNLDLVHLTSGIVSLGGKEYVVHQQDAPLVFGVWQPIKGNGSGDTTIINTGVTPLKGYLEYMIDKQNLIIRNPEDEEEMFLITASADTLGWLIGDKISDTAYMCVESFTPGEYYFAKVNAGDLVWHFVGSGGAPSWTREIEQWDGQQLTPPSYQDNVLVWYVTAEDGVQVGHALAEVNGVSAIFAGYDENPDGLQHVYRYVTFDDSITVDPISGYADKLVEVKYTYSAPNQQDIQPNYPAATANQNATCVYVYLDITVDIGADFIQSESDSYQAGDTIEYTSDDNVHYLTFKFIPNE